MMLLCQSLAKALRAAASKKSIESRSKKTIFALPKKERLAVVNFKLTLIFCLDSTPKLPFLARSHWIRHLPLR